MIGYHAYTASYSPSGCTPTSFKKFLWPQPLGQELCCYSWLGLGVELLQGKCLNSERGLESHLGSGICSHLVGGKPIEICFYFCFFCGCGWPPSAQEVWGPHPSSQTTRSVQEHQDVMVLGLCWGYLDCSSSAGSW